MSPSPSSREDSTRSTSTYDLEHRVSFALGDNDARPETLRSLSPGTGYDACPRPRRPSDTESLPVLTGGSIRRGTRRTEVSEEKEEEEEQQDRYASAGVDTAYTYFRNISQQDGEQPPNTLDIFSTLTHPDFHLPDYIRLHPRFDEAQLAAAGVRRFPPNSPGAAFNRAWLAEITMQMDGDRRRSWRILSSISSRRQDSPPGSPLPVGRGIIRRQQDSTPGSSLPVGRPGAGVGGGYRFNNFTAGAGVGDRQRCPQHSYDPLPVGRCTCGIGSGSGVPGLGESSQRRDEGSEMTEDGDLDNVSVCGIM